MTVKPTYVRKALLYCIISGFMHYISTYYTTYFIAGNFGKVFNLANWRFY